MANPCSPLPPCHWSSEYVEQFGKPPKRFKDSKPSEEEIAGFVVTRSTGPPCCIVRQNMALAQCYPRLLYEIRLMEQREARLREKRARSNMAYAAVAKKRSRTSATEAASSSNLKCEACTVNRKVKVERV
jgi:hypothetical protein